MASDALQEMERQTRYLKLAGLVVVAALLAGVIYFVWVWFLDPAGKLAWRWPAALPGQGEIVGTRDGLLLVSAKDQLLQVQPHSGKQVGSTTLAVAPAGLATRVELLPDGFLVHGDDDVTHLAADGKLMCQVTLPYGVVYSPDYALASYVANGRDAQHPESGWTQSLVCVDLRTGKERWRQPAPASVAILGVAATSETVVAVSRKVVKVDANASAATPAASTETTGSPGTPDNDKAEEEDTPGYHTNYKLLAFDATNGKPRDWHVRLPRRPLWGPEVIAGKFVVQYDARTLAAISPAGEQSWTAALPPTADRPTLFAQGGLLLALYGGATLAYDAATGKGLWVVPIPTSQEDLVVTDRAVFFIGQTVHATGIKVSRMPGFDQDPALVKDLGLDQKVSQKAVPLLVCVDRATGEIMWREEQVRGRLLADNERVVVIMAGGAGSPLAMLQGSSDTIVQQYAYATGKMLCNQRTTNTVLLSPTLAGDRVVGCAYDPDHITHNDGDTGPATTLTAFHLK